MKLYRLWTCAMQIMHLMYSRYSFYKEDFHCFNNTMYGISRSNRILTKQKQILDVRKLSDKVCCIKTFVVNVLTD